MSQTTLETYLRVTVFVPLAAQGAYQSYFRWTLIKTLISWFFSSMENNLETLIVNLEVMIHKIARNGKPQGDSILVGG